MKFRATPLQITCQRLAEEGKEKDIVGLMATITKDLLQNERGQLLIMLIRQLEVGYMDALPQTTDPTAINRLVGAMGALGDLRNALTSLLPEDEAFPEEEAEEDLIEYDSPFQFNSRAHEEPK